MLQSVCDLPLIMAVSIGIRRKARSVRLIHAPELLGDHPIKLVIRVFVIIIEKIEACSLLTKSLVDYTDIRA